METTEETGERDAGYPRARRERERTNERGEREALSPHSNRGDEAVCCAREHEFTAEVPLTDYCWRIVGDDISIVRCVHLDRTRQTNERGWGPRPIPIDGSTFLLVKSTSDLCRVCAPILFSFSFHCFVDASFETLFKRRPFSILSPVSFGLYGSRDMCAAVERLLLNKSLSCIYLRTVVHRDVYLAR